MIIKNNCHFAEIIDSSLHEWRAQCWLWNNFPSFGSLVSVKSNNKILYGVVHQIQMGSMDPTRYPFPYKKTEEELLKEQPQIFEFLKTTFSCITLGYKEMGQILYLLSPEPPKIHSFVSKIASEEKRQFFSSNKYLHLIFGLANQIFNLDELLLAMIHNQAKLKILNEEKLSKFVDDFSLLTGNDYRRLKIFLQRVEPLIQNKGNNSKTEEAACLIS